MYKITSTDGGYNMTDFADVPKSSAATDTVLAENISINKGATHTYKIEIKYLESSTVNQDEDQGKKLSGKIFITKASNPTLASKILEDNSTIGTRTDFSTPFTTNTVNTLYKATENGTDVYYFAGVDVIEEHCEYNGNIIQNAYAENKLTEAQCLSEFSVCQIESDIVYGLNGDCESDYGGTSITSNGIWISSVEKPVNNWVKFGKNSSNQDLYWRIIRTNADGSIRLLYHGTSTTATDAYIGASAFNTTSNSPKYVGYMYGDTDTTPEEARTNTNDSTIKAYIDNWYANNMTSYTKYLSTTAVYCNDRELASGSTYATSSSTFYFKPYERLEANKTPTYDCTNIKDAFSVNNTEAKLTYPIALMTADELAYAGGVYGIYYTKAPMWYYTNSSFESSTGTTDWWSLSPRDWSGSVARTWVVYGSDYPGVLDSNGVRYSNGVRPAVSLKACIKYRTGNGTSETPYEIAETSSGC